ncbi:MAG: ABC transporter ATP-binding protein [Planctomycetes bacterium]|nr:ABC transporter ATP-binding protein [Planctomycetota bacterium]
MPQLVVENLTKDFVSGNLSLPVLRGVSISLSACESLAVLGPSGSGKSTLLSILGTLDTPSHGSVRLEGEDPFLLGEPELARWRRRHVGFVFQDHYLLGACTALENVLVPLLADGASTPEAVQRARMLLDRVGLTARLDHRPAELSGGERQRVALARALIGRPTLLLADEPTGNLDRATAQDIGRLLVELQADENTMLVVATHSPELAAMMKTRRELVEGRLTE